MWNSAESGLIGPEIQGLVARALSEDLGAGDPTTQSLIPPGLTGKAVIVSKASGVVAGCEITQAVFRAVDAGIKCTWLQGDGAQVDANGAIGEVEGSTELGVASSRAGAELSHQAHPVVGSGPNIDPLGPSVLKLRLSGLIPSDIRLSIKVYASADFELRVRIAFPDDHVAGS